VDIAQLQTERAYQTVANEVAVAYYQLLRAQSLGRIARESVRRVEDDLGVPRKLAQVGVNMGVLRTKGCNLVWASGRQGEPTCALRPSAASPWLPWHIAGARGR
jgi:hypothetical protein